MARNYNPIYSYTGDIQWAIAPLTTGNTAYDGTGTVSTASVAGPDGNFIQRIRFKASGSTTATVARIFINNGSGSATATNNFLFDEVTLPATTAVTNAATSVFEIPMNFALPPNYKILVTAHIAPNGAGGGWYVGTVGGSYSA
jgi:hypothetical protein